MEFQMGVNTKICVYLVLHFYLEVKIFFFFFFKLVNKGGNIYSWDWERISWDNVYKVPSIVLST